MCVLETEKETERREREREIIYQMHPILSKTDKDRHINQQLSTIVLHLMSVPLFTVRF